MSDYKLKNAPLVEAILEVKWALTPDQKLQGADIDPHYRILLGRLFDKLSGENGMYPIHEELPSARMPDEIAGHIVQHRFASDGNYWPLVQVGPGIITLNETRDYDWNDFKERASSVIKTLYNSYPKPQELKVQNLILRYINSVDFDYLSEDILTFIRQQLKTQISLPESLFENTYVNKMPESFVFQSSFQCSRPECLITIKFGTGSSDNKPALLWEMVVESRGDGIPEMPEEFEDWLNASHDLIDDWFRKLIKGELERRFQDDGSYTN